MEYEREAGHLTRLIRLRPDGQQVIESDFLASVAPLGRHVAFARTNTTLAIRRKGYSPRERR
jgi:hypothetical protein